MLELDSVWAALYPLIAGLSDWAEPLRLSRFYQSLGPIAPYLLLLMTALWWLLIERVLFLLWRYPRLHQQYVARWFARSERVSWSAQTQREAWLFEAKQALSAGLPLLQVLVKLCPMMGLLGTLLGMIGLFELMAKRTAIDSAALSDGIAQATLPTLVGMSAAVLGLFFYTVVQRWTERLHRQLNVQLRRKT